MDFTLILPEKAESKSTFTINSSKAISVSFSKFSIPSTLMFSKEIFRSGNPLKRETLKSLQSTCAFTALLTSTFANSINCDLKISGSPNIIPNNIDKTINSTLRIFILIYVSYVINL